MAVLVCNMQRKDFHYSCVYLITIIFFKWSSGCSKHQAASPKEISHQLVAMEAALLWSVPKGCCPAISWCSSVSKSEEAIYHSLLHSWPYWARLGKISVFVYVKIKIKISLWNGMITCDDLRLERSPPWGSWRTDKWRIHFRKQQHIDYTCNTVLLSEVILHILIMHGRIYWHEYLIMQGKYK